MYGKIYEQTFTGSMCGSGAVQFSTWAYVIAYTKPDHRVELNPGILAHLIGCDEKDVREAITSFCSPDGKSRNKAQDGRKLLKEGEFLYFVVNHDKFRGLRDDDGRKEYMRKYMRERRKGVLTVNCKQSKPQLAQATAYASASCTLKEGVRGRFEEWMAFRKGNGRKVKDWGALFSEQATWIQQFREKDQLEILSQSIRNGWQGLFELKRPPLKEAKAKEDDWLDKDMKKTYAKLEGK